MRTRFYQNLLEKYGRMHTQRKKDSNFFAVFVYTFVIYGFEKKDSNLIRSFYLLFEGAVTCRVWFVDTTFATTALSKYI